MTCGHCERAVKAAVQQVDPQAVVTIDRAANRVDIDSTANRLALAQAIKEEGYAVSTD
jgi:copper chaperone